MVWFHGGGWVGGELDWPEADWVARGLAARGVTTVSATYRKAVDGAHFPVPLDDAVTAWRNAAASGGDWVIGGASAGANLAAGTTLRMRDEGGPMPVGTVLAYPLLHPELPPSSAALDAALARMPAGGWVFSRDDAAGFTRNYEPTWSEPYPFPALGDLDDFPPTILPTAEFDTLRASSDAFRKLLPDARETVFAAAYHGFLNEPSVPAASAALDAIADWLLKSLSARSLRS
jgi:acetyl esterase/lipase